MIVSRLLKPEFVRADLPVILASQETRSRNTDEFHVPVQGHEFGLTSLLISVCWSNVQKSWRSERCTSVFVGFSVVTNVHAPDSGHDLEECEKFMEEVTNIYVMARGIGPKTSFCAGDFNVELLLLCIGEETDEELDDFYGPLCWQGYGAYPCGFKKFMWLQCYERIWLQSSMAQRGRTKRVGLHSSAMEQKRA